MQRKFAFLFTIFSLYISSILFAQNQRPAIGLTLSGGGARGLAHIGILHAIDSAGLKIDYITGTSMGSIAGGLYAAGYTAAEIEKIALSLDWESLFSNRPPLSMVHPSDKADFGRTLAEIPFQNGRFRLGSGVIESQALWNVLSELFLPVYHLSDFNKFPIPFACVATDVATGEAIYFHKGDIVTAIRASMAIPSVFTSVDFDGKRLVDGGIARNFPVKLARDMGADFVIGVNVSQGLRPAEELNNIFEIIYQLGFYKNEISYKEDWRLTNLYINPELSGYSAASFNAVKEIIEIGKAAGRRHYAQFKALAQAQEQENPWPQGSKNRLPDMQTITIDSVAYEGLKNVDQWFVRYKAGLKPGATIHPREIIAAVDRLYATNHFNRVRFRLDPAEGNHAKLTFIFDEKATIISGLALNYNSFNGVGVVAHARHNKLLFYNVRAYLKAEIGDQPDLKTGISYFWDNSNYWWANVDFSANRLLFPVFEDFFKFGEYSQFMMEMSATVNRQLSKNSYLSFGNTRVVQSVVPKARSSIEVRGSNTFWRTFLQYQHLDINNHAFPTQGKDIFFSLAHISNQNPKLSIFLNQQGPVPLEEAGIFITNFQQLLYRSTSYYPINPNLTLSLYQQAAYNFNYKQEFLNGFNVGGSERFMKNQMVFFGLKEYQILTDALVSLGAGGQYNLGASVFALGHANIGLYGFKLNKLENINMDNLIWGLNAGLGYNSIIGPVRVMGSYNPQAKQLYGFISLGWQF